MSIQRELSPFEQSLFAATSDPRARRMVELDIEHGDRFFDGDVDAILAHFVDEPVYELYPESVRFTGVEAVRLYHERQHANTSQLDPRSRPEDTRVLHALSVGADHISVEFSAVRQLADGTRRRCHQQPIIVFDGDLLVGERIYSDRYCGELRRRALGDDFFARPDVVAL